MVEKIHSLNFFELIIVFIFIGNVNYQFMGAAKKYHADIIITRTNYVTNCIVLTISIALIIAAFTDTFKVMRGSVMSKVSQSMLDVMQGIKEGGVYILRGDLGYGLEEKREFIKSKRKTCKSLSPLMRKGLIEFVVPPTDMSRYYRVRLTPEGEMLLQKGLK